MHDGNDSDFAAGDAIVVRKRRKGIYVLPNLFTLAVFFVPWCSTAWMAASPA
jgi:CDP-diacylglycerol--serine O-phosphatidyltransferase